LTNFKFFLKLYSLTNSRIRTGADTLIC